MQSLNEGIFLFQLAEISLPVVVEQQFFVLFYIFQCPEYNYLLLSQADYLRSHIGLLLAVVHKPRLIAELSRIQTLTLAEFKIIEQSLL
jgi:hypothetical protein